MNKIVDQKRKYRITNIKNSSFDKQVYVCSYGGCGSKMLTSFLQNYFNVKHVHSRKPPLELEYIGAENNISDFHPEWFNGVKIPNDLLPNFTVIYIYKNPVDSIYSRFDSRYHLRNIQTEIETKPKDVLEKKEDLYGIEEFFDNYTKPDPNRNYKIICVKYEEIFDKQQELFDLLGIKTNGNLMVKKETPRDKPDSEVKIYEEIYKPLKDKMKSMKFIEIV